jgi:hypothetical protein
MNKKVAATMQLTRIQELAKFDEDNFNFSDELFWQAIKAYDEDGQGYIAESATFLFNLLASSKIDDPIKLKIRTVLAHDIISGFRTGLFQVDLEGFLPRGFMLTTLAKELSVGEISKLKTQLG